MNKNGRRQGNVLLLLTKWAATSYKHQTHRYIVPYVDPIKEVEEIGFLILSTESHRLFLGHLKKILFNRTKLHIAF